MTVEYPVFPVVLDACVLYPLPLRDTLLRAAGAGIYRPHWSLAILEEVTRNLLKRGRLNQLQADDLQQALQKAFPQAIVEVPMALIAAMTNHPKDRHVLAAAVRIGAQVIVTTNIKDFQKEDLQPWDVEAQHPDAFLCHLYHIDPQAMVQAVVRQAQALKRPPMSVQELLERLELQVPQFAALVREVECPPER
ncbi:PIN domain-containing protein [Gloeobacter kilaueensis]|uniref:Uncharacterized protein n=1 Tax=Gloeobacter kilaueensis (strain ATCC BAA-2537 / CCAP 1431/1 / ULC 316 / JS1) TaxID=1183438 RepID=U5QS44_GLOK1|nr:PIN domain-containing protein [Gloeobacter kilaueensis]AGY60444.1 hypothetical protein GKIL_4198 [Gloeobacter kilaueensis JS1]